MPDKNNNEWTKEKIIDLLKRSDGAVEKGIVAIYGLQTIDEQDNRKTAYDNGVGFNAFDADFGTGLALQLIGDDGKIDPKKHLTSGQLRAGRKMIIKYARQLAMVANSKSNINSGGV